MAPSPPTPAAGPVITVENLGKRFGDVVGLGGIDLEVTANPQAVRERIGLAGQYAAVDENLRMVGQLTHLAKKTVRRRSDELIERFDLVDAADRTVRTYSGGMRRRLDLAAALVDRPPVLFLDEPTTGLDPRSRSDLWGVIEELVADGTTVLLTTQYLEEADRLADRIAVIDGGKKIAEGTSSELKATMGATIIEMALSGVDDATRAQSVLARIGHAELNGQTLQLSVEEGARSVLAAARALDDEGVVPETFIVREPTLDDVFLTLTGHGTSSPSNDQADRPSPNMSDEPPLKTFPMLETDRSHR
jgi:ABC-2 type transport system ATP-binding protein